MPSPSLDFRNVNSLWSSVLVETLARSGVSRAVVSPGSRSTPLTVALARHAGIEAIPVLDERSAAFFALGLAKQKLEPVVLVCTSGTAGANYYPAIIEAHESGVPLIVITADRPPELRDCASGQTIDQQKLFGRFARFYHELALPGFGDDLLRYLRQTVAHAVGNAMSSGRGPVHLNAPFRDPLAPVSDGTTANLASRDWAQFFAEVHPTERAPGATASLEISPDVHGLIVAGPQSISDADRHVAAVGELARKLGWPVVSDGLSPLRNQASRVPHLVTAYDTILRNAAAAERLKPEVVILIGDWPTSKVLRAWLAEADAVTWIISERNDNRDSLHSRSRTVHVDLAAFAAAIPAATSENGYTTMWARYEQKARGALDQRVVAIAGMFEGRAAWLLARHLPKGANLCVANSMPVRDVEYFWPPNDGGVRPFVNRGGNGIDGTLSTALGVAHGAGAPTVLLTGDLALLHDTNGCLLRPRLRGSLTVVLINNRGGGIFNHLPIAQFEPPFEEFFATPQEANFAQLCAAYGAEHVRVRDYDHFIALITTLPTAGVRVLELETDRKSDAATRKTMFAEIAAAL
jgi:2-succinyl-5-enolpyruvyl-6-hydroxy-3-cyclohexene-1-carboxylate synthase